MKDNALGLSIFAILCILLVSGFLLSLIIPNITEQDPSDCKSSEIYDSSTKRCRAKTEDEKEKERIQALEEEIEKGKQDGSICLTAEESWNHIGETTCVVFYPEYFYQSSSGYLFIDEKKNYKDGFVGFFVYRNMLSWDEFISRYSIGKNITIYGTIVPYEGHPEIRIYDLDQINEPKLVNCETSYGCVYTRGAEL